MNIPTQETEEQKSKCITKGCRNYKHQGEFIGDLCAPCFLHITSGNVIPTESFVGDLQRELTAVTEQRDRLLEEREQWRLSSVCRELTEQRDRLAEELKPQWLNIESAPKDGTYILATDDGSWKGCFICHWDDVSGAHYTPVREFGWATHYDDQTMQYESEDPTHWMPLPSLPLSNPLPQPTEL
jgi:hypothetical protein